MSRDEVIAKLRQHAPELQAKGILRLSLFGSTAREEATTESDVDLMADFDPAKRISLLGVIRLERQLSDLLGQKVDLCTRRSLRPFIKERAEAEAVRAF